MGINANNQLDPNVVQWLFVGGLHQLNHHMTFYISSNFFYVLFGNHNIKVLKVSIWFLLNIYY